MKKFILIMSIVIASIGYTDTYNKNIESDVPHLDVNYEVIFDKVKNVKTSEGIAYNEYRIMLPVTKIKWMDDILVKELSNAIFDGEKNVSDKEKLKELAEGRVWTGTEAVKNGLADEIGGLYSTIYAITEDNDIDDYTVVLAKDKVEIGNIYKKYSRYIKMDKKDLIKTTVFKDYLYNKPVTYLPYDILD